MILLAYKYTCSINVFASGKYFFHPLTFSLVLPFDLVHYQLGVTFHPQMPIH